MNDTLRVFTDDGSIIVKQSKPFVAKYPDIPAPIERLNSEAYYFELANSLKDLHPQILFHDKNNNILIMEDLGKASDLSSIYNEGKLNTEELNFLANYLIDLHNIKLQTTHENTQMRKLNNEYIFEPPFSGDLENMMLEVNESLYNNAKDIILSERLKPRLNELSNIYTANLEHLSHGDFYPGSILKTENGLKIIDAEFSFLGPREWDVAIFAAHLMLSPEGFNDAKTFIDAYLKKQDLNMGLVGFIGLKYFAELMV